MATSETATAVQYLRSLKAVRERCYQIYDAGLQDRLSHFAVHPERLEAVADYVLEVIKDSYPSLEVPFHSRWRHFEAGGVNRKEKLEALWTDVDTLEKVRRLLDLCVVSVLLDAGAGPSWKFLEREGDQETVYNRSEGLAVASWHLFVSGAFSSNPNNKWQVDAKGLQNLTLDTLRTGMQVSDANPLLGLEGRFSLLQRLGQTLEKKHQYFSKDGRATTPSEARVGHLLDYLIRTAGNSQASSSVSLPIEDLWFVVIDGFQDIWPPTRTSLGGVNLGDVWQHSWLETQNGTVLGGNLVPFHKLSQWLTYSLLEPLAEAGVQIPSLAPMTGLPEYRNGGLLLDMGVLVPKRASMLEEKHEVHSEVVVEWRALTVALLDQLADKVRQKLGKTPEEFPLVKVLEGGSWKAGRLVARRLRPADGGPPLQVLSDGTVF